MDVENGVAYYRNADRMEHRDGLWYFASREGLRGPFESSEIAELQLKRYVDTMDFVNDNKSALPTDVDWGDVTYVDIEKPPF
jgi:hypothetical protein